jgi:hypothetical protein
MAAGRLCMVLFAETGAAADRFTQLGQKTTAQNVTAKIREMHVFRRF